MSIFIITDPVDGKGYDIKLLPDELKRIEEGNYSIKNILYYSQLSIKNCT